MTSISSFVPADYTVWAIAGVCFVTALADALFVLATADRCSRPQAARSRRGTGPVSNPMNEGILWYPRLLMYMSMALWGASLILPLNVLWGPDSVVAGPSVTNWTSQGWLCRIFITLALGITAPLACCLGLCILAIIMCRLKVAEASSQVDDQESTTHCFGMDLGHLLQQSVIISLIIVLPISAAQSVIAWIGLTMQYDGGPIEESPTSVLGTFLAVFWYGNPTQCTSLSSPTNESVSTNEYACTMCVFPAASVIVHGVWTLIYAVAVAYVAYILSGSSLLSRKLKQVIIVFASIMCLGSLAGLACMGISIYYSNPFEWSNQGLWLGYVATVLSSTIAFCYILDDLPKRVQQEVQNRTSPPGVTTPPTPVFSPIHPSQVLGAQRAQVFNPLQQVLHDRPLQETSSASQVGEVDVSQGSMRKSTRATMP